MSAEKFNPPDEVAMWTLLETTDALSAAVLDLAWRAGLTRREIWELRWEQVDFAARALRLPDRSVPLEEETAQRLARFRATEKGAEFVASSPRRRERVAEQHISRLARRALNGAGMPDVRLIDLRHDFVRRTLERYDWTYALRVSGLSVATYRALFAARSGHGNPTMPPETPEADRAARLWRLLREHRSGAAGVGLWLSQQANLKHDEIVTLTWDMVDLDAGILRLPRGDVYMIKEVIDVLREEKARRAPDDDPHVLLSPRSRRPIDKARLSTLLRDLFIHGGLEDVYADTLRRSAAMSRERETILRQAERAGQITRAEVERLLGVKPNVAYSRLADLVQDGLLVSTSKGYYPAARAIPRERWAEAALALAAERGGVTVRDLAALLHTGRYTADRLLRRLVASGALVTIRDKGLYLLPERPKTSQMLHLNDNETNA